MSLELQIETSKIKLETAQTQGVLALLSLGFGLHVAIRGETADGVLTLLQENNIPPPPPPPPVTWRLTRLHTLRLISDSLLQRQRAGLPSARQQPGPAGYCLLFWVGEDYTPALQPCKRFAQVLWGNGNKKKKKKVVFFLPPVTVGAAPASLLLLALGLLNEPEQQRSPRGATLSDTTRGFSPPAHPSPPLPLPLFFLLLPPILPLRQESIFHKRAVELQCPIISR